MMRWILLYMLWNFSASVIFMVPHDLMQPEAPGGMMYPLLLLSCIGYMVSFRSIRHNSTRTDHLIHWTMGFHFLFWGEMVMEAIFFTLLDFHDTDANDPYFIAFWVLVLLWTIGGWGLISRQNGPKTSR